MKHENATIRVHMGEFKNALTAVYPHRSKTGRTVDAAAMNRVRLTFAGGWLFVTACNPNTSALARVEMVSDSRDPLGRGELDADDSPIVIDLDRKGLVDAILKLFKLGQRDDDVEQFMEIGLHIGPDDMYATLQDQGGVCDGESLQIPIKAPEPNHPDVIHLIGKAIDEVALTGEGGKTLQQNGKVMVLFKEASVAYGADLAITSTGGKNSQGFLVECGPSFSGLMLSMRSPDDGKATDVYRQEMLHLLKPAGLKSVG